MNVPTGWKLVPDCETPEWRENLSKRGYSHKSVFRDVLAAAPAAPAAVVQAAPSELTVAPVDAAYHEAATAMHAAQDKLAEALAMLNEISLMWHGDTVSAENGGELTAVFDDLMERVEAFTLPERLK